MGDVIQNTLYLTTPATFVARDDLTLQVEVPIYPPDLPSDERRREHAADWRKLSIPIHHLESVCAFGPFITMNYLTAVGLDPFVGFLHAERPNRPALALDLMEAFRAWIADRLAITLINRRQIGPEHFREREGGAVEFTDAGRRLVIAAYQERKKETMQLSLLEQNLRIGQMPFIQARILARHLRGDLLEYFPLVPK